MMFKISLLPTSLLVNGQHMEHQFSCIQDSFQYRILCNYWIISSRARVRVNSRKQSRGLLWQFQGVVVRFVDVGELVMAPTIIGADTDQINRYMLHLDLITILS